MKTVIAMSVVVLVVAVSFVLAVQQGRVVGAAHGSRADQSAASPTERTEVVLLPTGLCGLVFDCSRGAPRATVDPGKLVLLPTGLCGLVFDCSKGYPGSGG